MQIAVMDGKHRTLPDVLTRKGRAIRARVRARARARASPKVRTPRAKVVPATVETLNRERIARGATVPRHHATRSS